MFLFNLFNRSKLTVGEKKVLAAVSTELAPTARSLFVEQVNLVNLVQRHADGKEVNLYAMRRGRPFMNDQLLFPLRSEAQLATVEMDTGKGKKSFRASIWLANGRVFSIEFNRPPQTFLEQGVNIIRVEILCDPMAPASNENVTGANWPKEILTSIRSRLPDEYLKLVGDVEQVSINEWAVYGLTKIRKIAQRDMSYYLLAEKEGVGAVGVKADETSSQLYYLDYGDDRGEEISVGLRLFLERFDGGKVVGRF